MDLDETWQVGLRPEKTKPCTFPAKSRYGFRREREKWVAEALFFCHAYDAPLLHFSWIDFRQTFHEHLSRWRLDMLSYSRKVSIKGSNLPKTPLFKGTLFVTRLWVTGNVLRRLHCFNPLVDIPQMCLTLVTFAEGCTVFQLSTSERLPLPRYQQRRNLDAYTFFNQTYSPGARRSDRRFAVVHYSSAHFLVVSEFYLYDIFILR